MKISIGLVIACSVSAAGCGKGLGNDLCTRARASNQVFNGKVASCPTLPIQLTIYSDTQVAGCSSTLSACSAAQTAAITAYFDCLDALSACDPANPNRFANTFANCGYRPTPKGCFCLPAGNACQANPDCCGSCSGSTTCI